nr:hypothetical protein [uncultured Draconibacterium sp.]
MGKNNNNAPRLDKVFGYASFLGFVLTAIQLVFFFIAYFKKTEENSSLETILITTVIAIVLVNITLVFYALYLTRKHESIINSLKFHEDQIRQEEKKVEHLNKTLEDSSKLMHSLNHEFRYLFDKFYSAMFEGDNSDSSVQKMKSDFLQFLQFFVSNIRSYYNMLTKDNCSVYISIITETFGERFKIKTYYRDPNSYVLRHACDQRIPEYLHSDFTPFKSILNTTPETIYYCNDCKNAIFSDWYDGWNKHYNACISVPIRIAIDDSDEHSYIGFITVDNFKGGFETIQAQEPLKAYADLLYNLFALYDDYCEIA